MAEIKPFFDAYETGNFLIKGNKFRYILLNK